jgi:ABC-type molybdenum transport system ATPase subunit/photorepair protein PhrA
VAVGLDPIVTKHISKVLHRLAEANEPRIVLSLRPQDEVPEWLTHLVYVGGDGTVERMGPKEEVSGSLETCGQVESSRDPKGSSTTTDPWETAIPPTSREQCTTSSEDATLSRDGYENTDASIPAVGEPIVEMHGVRIAYGKNSVLGDWEQEFNGSSQSGLHWNVHRGQRWGIFGANGSGKTTLLSLVTSDHPQTYSAPVKLFRRSRLPEPGVPGITIFEIQSQMGHASPEVHALFPKRLTLRTTLESAWADTPITRPRLDDEARKRVDACLTWFEAELRPGYSGDGKRSGSLEWASNTLFGEVSFSAQRVLLFLRATIRNPDIVILDEAFSGMDDLVRDKCLLFLSRGQGMELVSSDGDPRPIEWEGEVVVPGLQEHQALLCVSHSKHEVPGCIREWICLPEPGTGPPRFGRFDGPVELDAGRWHEVWNEN